MSKKQKNLAVISKKDITIYADGSCFISQSELSNLCGVDQSTISKAISRKSSYVIGAKLNEKNQLDYDSAFNVILYHAMNGKQPAIQTLGLIGSKGMKVFIYDKAGYQFNAVPRSELLENKRLAQWTWSDSLKFQREKIGKKTSNFHYSNENLMLNQVVLGERRAFAEHEMTNKQIEILEKARTLNGSMIDLNLPFQDRKLKLIDWFNNL